jgi:hypothetical protein
MMSARTPYFSGPAIWNTVWASCPLLLPVPLPVVAWHTANT